MLETPASLLLEIHPRIRVPLQDMLDQAQTLSHTPPGVTGEHLLRLWKNKERAPSDDVMSFRHAGFSALVVDQLIHQHSRNDRLFNWLYDLTFARSWSAPIHLPGYGAKSPDELSIELGSCSQGLLLALTAQLIGSWIRQQSETFHQAILDEIEHRLVRPFADGATVWWHPQPVPDDWMINNWTGVCGGCLLGMCVVLEKLGRHCDAAKNRAIDAINLYLRRAFTPAGECDEGIGYWCYGMEMMCLGLSLLDEYQLHTLIDIDRLKQVADYPRRVHIGGPIFYASNDSRSDPKAPHLCCTWLARVTNNTFLARWPDMSGFDTPRGLASVLAAIELQNHPAGPSPEPPNDQPFTRWLADQQILIHQRLYRGKRITLCMEGGNNDESHNHNDLGQVQLFVEAQPILLDPGLPQYVAGFFGKDRYNYLNPSSLGHNVPIIRQLPQKSGPEAASTVVSIHTDTARLCLDLTQAYPSAAGLLKWFRHLEAASLQVLDEIELSDPAPVDLCFWTDQIVLVRSDSCLAGEVRILFSPQPTEIHVDTFSASDLMLKYANPDKPYYRIRASFSGSSLRIHTRFCPDQD